MKITLDIDLEKFRYSLIGDGYLKEEVVDMPQDRLIAILSNRIEDYINIEYDKSRRFGLLDGTR